MKCGRSTKRTTIRTTSICIEAMNVTNAKGNEKFTEFIYAEGIETTMKTTKRIFERVQSFLKSRVQDIS
eukprot:5760926-Karenia_brevis.AAC.1